MRAPTDEERRADLKRRTSSATLTVPTGTEREVREPAFLSRVRTFPELFAELGLLPSIADASPVGKITGALHAVTPFVKAGVPLKALRQKGDECRTEEGGQCTDDKVLGGTEEG